MRLGLKENNNVYSFQDVFPGSMSMLEYGVKCRQIEQNIDFYKFLFLLSHAHKVLFICISADHSCICLLKYNVICFCAIDPQINSEP